MPKFKLQPGYGFKKLPGRPWREAEIVVVPQDVVGDEHALYSVEVDGAPCMVFATAQGLFAQTVVACRVS